MSPPDKLSHATAIAHALWLVDHELVDRRTRGLDLPTALAVRLEALGLPDERVARRVAFRLSESESNLLEVTDALGHTIFELCAGLPLLRHGLLPLRIARTLDPDVAVCLHRELAPPGEERFDWCPVPLGEDAETANLFTNGSVETHIHLGGSLPPVFYWVALMGAELHLDALAGLPSDRRGHAGAQAWKRAVAQALWRRYALLFRVGRETPSRRRSDVFGDLPPLESRLWKTFDEDHEEAPEAPLTIIRSVLALSSGARRRHPGRREWPFWDPLRDRVSEGERTHYAAGERRLLYHLGRVLRRPPEPGGEARRAWIHRELLAYLRTRNAFHQVLVHDRGTAGLLRFVESFGRRGFLFGQRGRRRRRQRRMALALEKSRMTAALDEHLVQAYPPAFPDSHHPPLRRLEMRVSVPPGRLLLRTLRAWFEGLRDHLAAAPGGALPRHSQVALVFHFIKLGDHERAARLALDAARRLGHVLMGYPWLRPLIVGIDAAGDERQSPPRVFGAAFHHLRQLEARHRPRPDRPRIRLGRTYHVGEDVADLLSGLRHLDEAVRLLLGPGGGRLGHALALAEDPGRFYARRGGQTEPGIGAHLLDLIWAWGRLAEARSPNHAAWITRRIHELGGDDGDRIETKVHSCFRAMGLVDPGLPGGGRILSEDELLDHLAFRGNPHESVTVTVDDRWLELVAELQRLLRNEFAYRRLTVEANPTSNLLIGGYLDYRELPYDRLVDDDIGVSVNTDDPGLFMTTLPGEFAALYRARSGKATHRRILSWLADRRFDADQSTFLGPHVPVGRDALGTAESPKGRLDRLFEFLPAQRS